MCPIITCVSVGSYADALTRGKQYEPIAHDTAKNQIRVRGNNGRTRWFNADCFDLTGNVAPTLTHWKFDDPVWDAINGRDATNNAVEVSLTLSDETVAGTAR